MAPTILIESLETVRRRVRILSAVFGLGVLLTAAVVALLVAVAIDYLLNLPPMPRALLTLLATAAIVYVLWRWLIRPLFTRLSLSDIAGRVESAYPQFQDRLRSTVDILSGKDLPGSDIMKQRVVSETTRLTQSLDLNRVVVARPVWYSTGAGLLALALVGLVAGTLSHTYTRTALQRLFMFSQTPWPRIVSIDEVGRLPERISVGQRMDVAIRLTQGDRVNRTATIYYQYGDASGQNFGPTEQEYMTRGDDGVYHASIDARTPADAAMGTIKIWTKSGDDLKELPVVKVVQRLSIAKVEAVITPPAYARLAPQHVDLAQGPAVVAFGSTIQLNVAFNKPLDADQPVTVESLTPNSKTAFHWAKPADRTISAQIDAVDTVRFHLHAQDVDGLKNTAAEEFEIVVHPDQNPTVVIENPRRSEDRTAESTVALQAVAEDDFGISSLKLIVDRVGDKKHWEIPLVTEAGPGSDVKWTRIDGSSELQRFRMNDAWDLASLKDAQLKPGDVLEYYASVRDNFSLNGQTHGAVASGHLRITIISQQELSNKIVDELNTVAEQITTLKQTQAGTQKQTASLSREVAGKPAMDNADKAAADRLAGQQSTVAAQTKSLAGELANLIARMDENKSPNKELKDTAKDVASLLNSAAENPMKNAAGDIANAKADARDQRDQDLSQAQSSQAKAGDTLEEALKRMGGIGSLSRTIDTIKGLLADQQNISAKTADLGKDNLGKTPDQMSPADKARLDQLTMDQTDLANRTAQATAEMAKDSEKLAKSDPAGSKAMNQAADTAQEQNVPGNMKKAADANSENKQSQTQNAQKQAELGLQMMLSDLREAEKHKLDELSKKLSELQQQVALLIREQSEHNLDDLALQGGDAMAKISAETRSALFADAQRDPSIAVPTDLGLLGSGQEQTERNARDIAKAAEALPEGGQAADRITQAADKMDRAIVDLRDNKLAIAYDPEQVAALESLKAAKKLIDAQKKKTDDKQEDQKKEAIRQAFIQIRVAQDDVNVRTAAVDSAPRNDDGSMKREQQVLLGQLPAAQGRVADQAQKLDEALNSLGSIVYSWANRDIVKNMKEVKDLIGRQETGSLVQSEQKQILAEIDAMIRDLATKPEESKFAQNNSGQKGGGGQSASKPMPTEAELRLIKDLQIAVNNNTIAQSKQKNLAKPELVALGGRQGDLRHLLDELLKKASGGKTKLPPEPDNKDQLPEEASGDPEKAQEAVDNAELDQELVGDGKPKTKVDKKQDPQQADSSHDLAVVGNRMARSRQRLALNTDPGAVTQEIQKRILTDLDDLIEQARKKESQGQNQPPQQGSDPQQAKPSKPADAKPQPQQGQENKPAATAGNNAGGGDAPAGNAGNDAAHQEARNWGDVPDRARQAVIEGGTEKTLDKYKDLVDDYYRQMNNRTKQ